MATRATEAPIVVEDHPDDLEEPFYGWRSVRRRMADGRYEYVQVPLTYDDLLNPRYGDDVIHNAKHQRRLHYLRNALEGQLRHDPTALVLDDVLIDWGIPGLRKHAPDISVFFGVRQRKNWSTFRAAREGVRAALLIELVSPDTARHDRTTKVQEYHRAGALLYVLIDDVRHRGEERLTLTGYRWTPTGYEPLEPDPNGRLILPSVRLQLGIIDDELICYDEHGQLIDDFAGQATRAEAEARRAEAEARRAEAEARRAAAAALHADAEARRANDEARRAELAAQRADDEARRADAEARARATAEQRLRELEAELRRLRGE
jgi:colicin import membrane protein